MEKGNSSVDLSAKIQELYAITKGLEAQFPGRRFTPDVAGFNTIASPLLKQIYSNRAENKRLLKKHKYPPEGMDDAVQTVMSQCEMWVDNP